MIRVVSLLFWLAACRGENGSQGGATTGMTADQTGMGAAGSQICDRYLSCLSLAAPSAYGAALQLYGPQSACWQNQMTTDGCNRACTAGVAAYVEQGQCPCASNTDCPADHPLCQNGACGGCGSDPDCAPSFCDSASHQCVACRSNSDCRGTTPHCDSGTHSCVGCQSDGDCDSEHHCDGNTGFCVECVDDSQCPPDYECYIWDQGNRCVGRASAAPSQLTCTRCNGDSICLSWKDNSNDESQFEVRLKLGTMSSVLGYTAANVTTYEVMFVSATKSYTFFVVSCNPAAGCLYDTGYCTVP